MASELVAEVRESYFKLADGFLLTEQRGAKKKKNKRGRNLPPWPVIQLPLPVQNIAQCKIRPSSELMGSLEVTPFRKIDLPGSSNSHNSARCGSWEVFPVITAKSCWVYKWNLAIMRVNCWLSGKGRFQN